MDQQELIQTLASLPLGEIRYFDSVGSTNNEALTWASTGAADLSIVIADEQTAGRGRLDRPWFTPPASALAFSLILYPTADEKLHLSRIVGLAALALGDALGRLGLAPQIKWPNDVLLNSHKVAGILTELTWAGEEVDAIVMGMGVNVANGAVPATETLTFPAISLEHVIGEAPDRIRLLHNILTSFFALRPHLHTDSFMAAWEKSLAYAGKEVQVDMGSDQTIKGKVAGLDSEGSLQLLDTHGRTITVRFGDVRLRLVA